MGESQKTNVLFDAIWPHTVLATIVGNSPKQTPFHLFLDAALKTPRFAVKLPVWRAEAERSPDGVAESYR